jgi:hypothetical protein
MVQNPAYLKNSSSIRKIVDFLYEYAHFLLEEGLQKEALPLLKQVLSMDGTNGKHGPKSCLS